MEATPLEKFYSFMEQNQYFIGNELLQEYETLLVMEAKKQLDTYNKGFNEGRVHNQLK